MIASRRRLSSLAIGFLGITALAGCQTQLTPATLVSDAQAVINDAAAILALNIVPAPEAAIARLVLTGFQALLATISGSLASGASNESTVVASLQSALKSVQANVPSTSQVWTYAATALTALNTLAANATATVQNQVMAAVGQALIAYLSFSAPAKAQYGAEGGTMADLTGNAQAHIANLKG